MNLSDNLEETTADSLGSPMSPRSSNTICQLVSLPSKYAAESDSCAYSTCKVLRQNLERVYTSVDMFLRFDQTYASVSKTGGMYATRFQPVSIDPTGFSKLTTVTSVLTCVHMYQLRCKSQLLYSNNAYGYFWSCQPPVG